MENRTLNIVSYIGMALVFGAVAIRVLGWIGTLSVTPAMDRYSLYAVWVGFALVLLYTVVQVARSDRRDVRYGAMAMASVVAVVAIIGLINYLSFTRFNKRVDFTQNSVNSLSEQSEKVLRSLDAPLKITVLDQGARLAQYRERLSMYENVTNRVSIEYVDAERDPIRAKQFEVQAYPTVALEYKGRTEKTTNIDERELTGAIIRATTGEQRKLYFVQGHGERDPNSNDRDPFGYSGVVQFLKADNIAVETLALTQHKEVPQDASALVIAGPTNDFLDDEIATLKQYLDRGGRVLLMVDPAIGERPASLTKIVGLAHDWGVDIGNDVIVDLSGRTSNPSVVVTGPQYPPHPIVDGFRINLIFPLARSVTATMPAPAGKTVQRLADTAPGAWAETNLDGLRGGQPPQLDGSSGDRPGPVGVAATVTTAAPTPAEGDKQPAQPPQTRMVVIGDADFASNAVGGSGANANANFFANVVNWLMAQESLIAIRPREPSDSRLSITRGQALVVAGFSVLVVPAIVLGTGIFTWYRRRRS